MIEITSNASEIAVKFQQAPAGIARAVGERMRRIGAFLQSTILRDKLRGGVLKARTGNLGRSLFYRVEVSGNDATLTVGADVNKAPQARIQEYGGVITPKNARYLTIPVGLNLTSNGVMRVNAREFFTNPQSLGYERAFVNPGRTAIMGANKGQQPEAVFALKTSVTLPERSYLRSTLTEQKDLILEQIGAAAVDGVQGKADSGGGE